MRINHSWMYERSFEIERERESLWSLYRTNKKRATISFVCIRKLALIQIQKFLIHSVLVLVLILILISNFSLRPILARPSLLYHDNISITANVLLSTRIQV